MFAHLRSKNAVLAKYQFLLGFISKKMRDNVRSHVSLLTGLDPSNHEVAGMLAEIHMREFACTLQTLNQVNEIAARYHEDAFDNTDAYIDGVQPVQLAPHEMTAEQRHASQLLLGVGKTHSEVNLALKCIGVSRRDIMQCDVTKMAIVAQQFQNQDNGSVAEDAFDRLQHITKQVWSLVNMMAFSNLFRFADPSQPICIANQDDAIFIPYIPTKSQQAKEAETKEDKEDKEDKESKEAPESECHDCGKTIEWRHEFTS